MKIDSSQLRPVGDFPLGVDNVSKVTPQSALKAADNIDLSDEGKPRRRAGYQLALAGAFHSLFGHEHLPFMLARRDDELVMIEGDGATLEVVEVIATGLGTGPASYEVLNNEVLWTVEGVATGCINSWGESRPLGVPTPLAPRCIAAAGGGLDAGRYLVAISFALSSGEEGGLCAPQAIDVAEGGAIVVELPDDVPGPVQTIRLWRSSVGGSALYHAKDVVAGLLEARLTSSDALGRLPDTLDLKPLPAGHIVRQLNGIPWMADGRMVYHGTALYRFLHHPGHDRLPYRDRIDMMQPVGEADSAAMFIASGKRIFYVAGSKTSQLSQTIARGHGAVPGTGLSVPASVFSPGARGFAAYWMGTDGVACVGMPGGEVRALTESRVAMHRFEQGASLLREADGLRSVVTAGRGGSMSRLGASDTAEVLQFRNGIPVP